MPKYPWINYESSFNKKLLRQWFKAVVYVSIRSDNCILKSKHIVSKKWEKCCLHFNIGWFKCYVINDAVDCQFRPSIPLKVLLNEQKILLLKLGESDWNKQHVDCATMCRNTNFHISFMVTNVCNVDRIRRN